MTARGVATLNAVLAGSNTHTPMEDNRRMEEFDTAVLSGTTTWWQMSLPSGTVSFGDAKADMLGYPAEKFRHYQDFVDLVHPDDREKTMQAMRDHLEGRAKLYETVYRIKHKDGSYIRFFDCGEVTKKEGDTVSVTGFVMKVPDGVDASRQMEGFKDLILGGTPSIIELVSRIRKPA